MHSKKENIISLVVGILLAGLLAYAIYETGQPHQNFGLIETKPPATVSIKDIVVGRGAEVKNGDIVKVHYIGGLEDGTKFDSSYDRKQPFEFPVGEGKVIKGWEIGLLGMKVGGKRELIVPPELGYGARANGPIPPNSTLKFIIELLGVKSVSSTQ